MEQAWSQTKDNRIRIQDVRSQCGSWHEMQTTEHNGEWDVAHCWAAQRVTPAVAIDQYRTNVTWISNWTGWFRHKRLKELLAVGFHAVKTSSAVYGTRRFIVYAHDSILTHMEQVHTLQTSFLKTHFNIIIPSTSVPSKWTISIRTVKFSALDRP